MGWIPSLWTTAQAVLSVFVLGVASTAGLLYRYQRSLVYPSNFPQGSRTDVLTPDHFGIPYEDLRLTTPDGETLHAFLMPQKTASEKEKARGENLDPDETVKRRPTILFLHANAGNMGHRLPLASVFYKRFGCNVLMLSYRGYGLSTGQPSEQGIRIDAQTALDWIRKHEALQKTVIVAYGQSIGGAVAVDLVSRNTKSVSGLVLRSLKIKMAHFFHFPHSHTDLRPHSRKYVPQHPRTHPPCTPARPTVCISLPRILADGRVNQADPQDDTDSLSKRPNGRAGAPVAYGRPPCAMCERCQGLEELCRGDAQRHVCQARLL